MGIPTLLWLAAGLASDAFAVSLGLGMASTVRFPVKPALWFGAFQGVMPLIGYGLAYGCTGGMQTMGHWLAALLLVGVGIKMMCEARRDDTVQSRQDVRTLLSLALATSVDALAVGVSLAVMPRSGILALSYGFAVSAGVIAAVTVILCLAGLQIGIRVGDRLGARAGVVGGAVLIGIGVKLLAEQIFVR